MAVISICIINSEEEIMAGIPRTVSITTNVSSLIFYTLDGSQPTLFSTQYTGLITLPVGVLTIVLNVFATNGTITSPTITEIYQTNMVDGNARFSSRNDTNQPPGFNLQQAYPFGNNPPQPETIFGNPANVGVTVDNPALPQISNGFDGAGNPNNFTNQPFDIINYNIKYSTTNAEGEMGRGIGSIPAKPRIDPPQPSIGPEQTNQFSNTFNPKAFVTFQNLADENPNDPPSINRMSYTLENPERARDGDYYYNSGLDAPPTSGSFVRSEYNPRTNEQTFYYYDSWTNKWIISTQPFEPTGPYDGNLSTVKLAYGGKVFEWPGAGGARRVLF